MAATSKGFARPRSPISATSRASSASREAALLVALPQSPEARRPDRDAAAPRGRRATACSTGSSTPACIEADELGPALAADVPDARADMPNLAPHLARAARDRTRRTRRAGRSASTPACRASSKALATERRPRWAPDLGGDPRRRPHERRGARRGRLGRLLRRARAPARSTWCAPSARRARR